jgi:hypothetical protein
MIIISLLVEVIVCILALYLLHILHRGFFEDLWDRLVLKVVPILSF